MAQQWLLNTRYSPLPADIEERASGHAISKREQTQVSLSRITNFSQLSARLSIITAFAVYAGFVGFAIGVMVFRDQKIPVQSLGVVPRVPIGPIIQAFRYDKTFADRPPARDEPEPIWDSLLPSGLGYVKDDPLVGHNISVISTFHQLHCLYTLRRAYYSDSAGDEEFDFGLDRTHHANHCFEYLRQSIMCSADSSLEPAAGVERVFLGWGFQRQCRNFEALKEWAEAWRAFELQGFLAHQTHRQD